MPKYVNTNPKFGVTGEPIEADCINDIVDNMTRTCFRLWAREVWINDHAAEAEKLSVGGYTHAYFEFMNTTIDRWRAELRAALKPYKFSPK